MKKLTTLFILCGVALSGCANSNDMSDTVSREEYQSVVSEINALKAQIESMENEDEQTQENNISIESEESIVYEEKTWDFSYEYDDNNIINYTVKIDSTLDIYVEGAGKYEEGNLGLVQSDYDWISDLYYEQLSAKEINLEFDIGEEKYEFVVSNYEVISDTVPMDVFQINPAYIGEYIDNGVMEDHQGKILEFFQTVFDAKYNP